MFAAKASAGNWRVAFDGASQSVSSNTTDFAQIMLGSDGAFGEYARGEFYRMVAYENDPTSGEQAALEAYLAS
jgi:hypothetical protein